MLDRHAVPLDVRAAHRGRVQQQVDQVVGQQVDLVDVERAAVRRGEQARLVRLHPVGERALDVEGADHPVLGGADRQLDQRRRGGARAGRPASCGPSGQAGSGAAGSQAKRQPRTTSTSGSRRGQRAHHRALRGALLAAHQHPADGGRHGGEQQREAQVVEADHGRERVRRHRSDPFRRVSTPACRWHERPESPDSRIDAARAPSGRCRPWRVVAGRSPVTVAGPSRNRTGFLRDRLDAGAALDTVANNPHFLRYRSPSTRAHVGLRRQRGPVAFSVVGQRLRGPACPARRTVSSIASADFSTSGRSRA